jgi:hypothetical protein
LDPNLVASVPRCAKAEGRVLKEDETLIRPSVWSTNKGITWGIKLDNCDLCRHVLLTKKSGIFKRICFSPDRPDEFVEVCKSNLTGW